MSEPIVTARVNQLHRSGIRAVMRLAAQRERLGKSVIHLEVGQPDFQTPRHIVDAVRKATQDGLPGYTPNSGIVSLREAVAERVSRRNDRPTTAANVCITSGAVMALQLALLAIVEPGDEVLVPDPGWPNYRSAVTLACGTVVTYPLDVDNNYALHIEQIAARITPRTKAIMVNSPGNPTGTLLDPATLTALLKLCDQAGIYVISDEVYEDFVFGSLRHTSAYGPNASDRVILVSGASKSYAMTGWRIGWLVAHTAIVDAAAALVEPQTSCPASVSQVAAEAALRGSQDDVETMRRTYERRATLATALLAPSGRLIGVPAGAFYAMIRVAGKGESSDAFVKDLLEVDGVAVAPGSTFGSTSENAVRLSLASSDENIGSGIDRILKRIQD